MTASVDFTALSAVERDAVERRAGELLSALASHHAGMREAIGYALLGGGKRLRAIACLWAHDFAGGGARDAALDVAVALECVHAYSLVHDDLPCMDDDDLRRGKPSVHVRFGEATAVLAGDALLTLAFEILGGLPGRHTTVTPGTALDAVRVLSGAAGTGGLITGQALDLESEGAETASIDTVERIHTDKTARLIAAAMELGAVVARAAVPVREGVRGAGLLAGRAFQIVDDLLDIAATKETLGKTPGKDVNKSKLTYPSVVGTQRARAEAGSLVEQAKATLGGLHTGTDAGPLCSMIDFIADRAA